MVRGMYTAASGMLVQQVDVDIIANNIANANTSGYRSDRLIRRAFPQLLLHRVNDASAEARLRQPIGWLGTGAFVDGTALSLQEGPLQFTGRSLDVAIVGDGFFVIETPAGQRLTRDGGFQLDSEGRLVTADGHPVLGVDGPIQVPVGAGGARPVTIGQDGSVRVGNERVGTLLVVGVDDPRRLGKEGGSRLVPNGDSGEPRPLDTFVLAPEHKEGSNVQVVAEMVRIISAYRAYEAAQRVVQAHDETLGRAVNDVARLA